MAKTEVSGQQLIAGSKQKEGMHTLAKGVVIFPRSLWFRIMVASLNEHEHLKRSAVECCAGEL